MTTKLIDQGIDYVRLTSDEPKVIEQMFKAARHIMVEEQKAGQHIKPGGAIGFYGHKTKHCFFGMRGDWAMFQVSGYVAREQYSSYASIPAHCTRLDLQQTVRHEEQATAVIHKHEDASNEAKSPDGRHWDTTLIRKNRRAETLYIGSRESEKFARIYDKFKESGKEEYVGCVRYELELKGDVSRETWRQMLSGHTDVASMLTKMVMWFEAHGIRGVLWGYNQGVLPNVPRETPTADKSIAWLAKQVKQTVARLVSEGYWWPTFNALFEEVLPREVRYGILHSMAITEI
jgi:hypothetical protein